MPLVLCLRVQVCLRGSDIRASKDCQVSLFSIFLVVEGFDIVAYLLMFLFEAEVHSITVGALAWFCWFNVEVDVYPSNDVGL